MSVPFLRELAAADGGPLRGVMLVVAHPDDETVGAGARLGRLREACFLHVTDGAPRNLRDALAAGCPTREEYARLRREELRAAFARAGIPWGRAEYLGLVDQEASLDMAGLARSLAERFLDPGVEVVLTHPYEGGHPDHDATAFAVHAAAALLRREGRAPPAVVEMASYHNGPEGIVVGEFLPHPEAPAVTAHLSQEERRLRRELLACFPSQHRTLGLFRTDVERFRAAPRYDFTRPPHEGKLFYEHFPWRMTGARWRGLAPAALEELGLRGPL